MNAINILIGCLFAAVALCILIGIKYDGALEREARATKALAQVKSDLIEADLIAEDFATKLARAERDLKASEANLVGVRTERDMFRDELIDKRAARPGAFEEIARQAGEQA